MITYMNSSQHNLPTDEKQIDEKHAIAEGEILPLSDTPDTPAEPSAPRLTRRALLSRGLALTGAMAAGDVAYETNELTITRHMLACPV